MTQIERILRLHEDNQRTLRSALQHAGGDLDILLDYSLSEALRVLAQNDIRLRAANEVVEADES